MQIDVSSMLALPDGLEVASIAVADTVLTIHIVATAKSNPCPLCAHAAIRVRSYYTRLVADVPCGGRQAQLIFHVRKFRCETADCPRQVFTERLAPFLEPWARMTTRLSKTIEAIGLATCGELGERFAPHLGIVISPTTILRRTMALPTCPPEHVSQFGIDDWSFRRGRKFGTILVDLATHKVIDLLPDRTTETAAAWMQAHPEIDIVSRDRGGDYAAAARKGAPQACEVADRFHLAQNLTDRIEVILSRCSPEIRKAFQGCAPSAFTEDRSEGNKRKPTQETNQRPSAPDHLAGSAHLAHQEERADRLRLLAELAAQGVTQKEIAHRLGMGERTVRYWLSRGIPYGTPESRNKRRKGFDPYASYIEERIRQGCRNAQELWREITAQGYKGSCRTVYRFLESRQKNASSIQGTAQLSQAIPESRVQHFSAQEAVWLFVRDPCDLEKKEQEQLTAIRQASPTTEKLYGLVQEFMRMIRQLEGERLDDWLVVNRLNLRTNLSADSLVSEH